MPLESVGDKEFYVEVMKSNKINININNNSKSVKSQEKSSHFENILTCALSALAEITKCPESENKQAKDALFSATDELFKMGASRFLINFNDQDRQDIVALCQLDLLNNFNCRIEKFSQKSEREKRKYFAGFLKKSLWQRSKAFIERERKQKGRATVELTSEINAICPKPIPYDEIRSSEIGAHNRKILIKGCQDIANGQTKVKRKSSKNYTGFEAKLREYILDCFTDNKVPDEVKKALLKSGRSSRTRQRYCQKNKEYLRKLPFIR